MKANDFTTVAIDKVKSQFEVGQEIILGCVIDVTRKQNAYQYIDKTGKMATMSARYWVTVTYPDGTKEDLKKVKGGVIARACGLWTRKERDDRNKQGNLHKVMNRRTNEE